MNSSSSSSDEMKESQESDYDTLQSKNNILGMILLLLGTLFIMMGIALIKLATGTYNVSLWQCIIGSNIIQNAFSWILWFAPSSITQKPEYSKLWYGGSEYRLNIWIRGVCYWCDQYFYFHGLALVSLGNAETIYFLYPLILVILARFYLKESFSSTFPFMCALLMIGLTVVCQPQFLIDFTNKYISSSIQSNSDYYSSQSINVTGLIFLILGCFASAIMNLMVRTAPKAHWIQLLIVFSFQAFAIWSPLLVLINYCIPDQSHDFQIDSGKWQFEFYSLLIICGIALCDGLGLVFTTIAYQHGEATKISWMEYVSLPYVYLLGFIMFNNIPNMYETFGSCIVVCGCSILQKERENQAYDAVAQSTDISEYENDTANDELNPSN